MGYAETMYELTLVAHSLLRWLVLVAGIWAVARAAAGLAAGRAWTGADVTPGRVFAIAFDVQLVVGLLLWGVLSPFVASGLANMGATMKSADLRYWVVEHPLPMIVALALAHVGLARAKRPSATHRSALIFFGVALVLTILSTPWPMMANGRPWLRLF
jgi:hypothetical protein